MFDVILVGAGVIGSMTARELSRYDLRVCLLEKGNDVAMGASRANSGIVHGGFDPKPGTLKARLNTAGIPKLYKAAKELSVPCIRNGSLVLAFGAEEEKNLRALYERGRENGIEALELLSGDEVRELEPRLSKEVTMALSSYEAGIICPYALTIAACGNAMDNGVELRRNFEVTEITHTDRFTVKSRSGETVEGKVLVNCAGLYADQIASLLNDGFFTLHPRAGEYLLLDKTEGGTVSHTIFQVPSKMGKGILVTPTCDGNLMLGPTAVDLTEKENNDTTFAGLEQVRTLAKKSVPDVNPRKVITSFTGLRAVEEHGDFIIRWSDQVENFLHLAAIDSPGLTCSAAIAEMAVSLIGRKLTLKPNPDFNPIRENPGAFRNMSEEEQNRFIKTHPAYGHIVCRCETVSEGEIRAAIRQNPPAWDVDGVKRRTRSGMGRCQGGFCAPTVMQLLSEELHIPMEEVTKRGRGSEMLRKEEL